MRPTLAAALALAACTSQPADNATTGNAGAPANDVVANDVVVETGAVAPAPTPAATPVETPDNSATPTPQPAETGESAEAAAQVVRSYYALLEAGKHGQAYRLWEPGAVGMTRRAFAASFDKYREYHARIGAPGDVDAGAGQRYVTVPVRVFGRLKDGNRPFNMAGSVTLHRTADIDGATAEQKTWRIRSADIKPRPGEPMPAPTEDNRSRVVFRCIDGSRMVANFDPDNRRVTIVRAGRTLVLRQLPSGSGIRYGDGRTTFSGKGDDMRFEAPGQPPLPCAPIRR